jgi:hypothetical protein
MGRSHLKGRNADRINAVHRRRLQLQPAAALVQPTIAHPVDDQRRDQSNPMVARSRDFNRSEKC